MDRIDPEAIFESEQSNQADFEIAFTAVVVTAVLATPVTGSGYTLLKALAISLSGLTLLRKMAVSNKHRDAKPVLQWTMPLILSITLISLIHLFIEMSAFIETTLNLPTDPVVIASAFIPIFVFGVFVAHEFVFHDTNMYLALLCHNAAVKADEWHLLGRFKDTGDELREMFLNKGRVFVTASKSQAIPPELEPLRQRERETATPSFAPLLIFAVVGYGAVWGTMSWIFGSRMLNIIFLGLIFLLKYPVQFWYSRFGLASFTSDRAGWIEVLVVFLGLLVANMTILPRY